MSLTWTEFVEDCKELLQISAEEKDVYLKWSFNGGEKEERVPGALYLSCSFLSRYPLSSSSAPAPASSSWSSRNKPQGINLPPPTLASNSDCFAQKNSYLSAQSSGATSSTASAFENEFKSKLKDQQKEPTEATEEEYQIGEEKLPVDGHLSEIINANEYIQQSSNTNIVKYDLHIIYSLAYSAPVLYFNVSCSDGSLLDIFKYPPKPCEGLENQIWNTLTQQDHPILNTPFYTLHPCNTVGFMGAFKQEQSKDGGGGGAKKRNNYLITWFSIVANVLGISTPIQYAKYV